MDSRRQELRLYVTARPWAFTLLTTAVVLVTATIDYYFIAHRVVAVAVPAVAVWIMLMCNSIYQRRKVKGG